MINYDVYWTPNSGPAEILHVAGSDNGIVALSSPTLKREVNTGSEFTFTIYPTHPSYDNIKPFNGTIDIYECVNSGKRKRIFHGKITKQTIDVKRGKQVTAQGGLYWLQWSQFSQYLNRYAKCGITELNTSRFAKDATVSDIVNSVLKTHNWQMQENVEENVGDYYEDIPGCMKLVACYAHQNPYGIDVTNTEDTQDEGVYISRRTNNLSTTYDWFQNELIEKCSASVVVDEDGGGITIYSETPPIAVSQELREGINVVKCTRETDFGDLCTVFFPYGKSVQTSMGTGTVRTTNNVSSYVNIADEGIGLVDYSKTKLYTIKTGSDENQTLNPDTDVDEDGNLTSDAKDRGIVQTANGSEVKVATDDEYPGGITLQVRSPFIIWKEGVERYGRIIGAKQWSNATRTQLRAYAPAHFKKLIVESEKVEVRAIDMALFDSSKTDSIQLGLRYRVVSPVHNLDEYIQCKSITLDLDKPSNTVYAFERKRKLFSLQMAQLSRIIRQLRQNGTQIEQTAIQVNDGVDGFIYTINDKGNLEPVLSIESSSALMFAIDGVVYDMGAGSTWEKWCADTSKNTDGWYINNGAVYRTVADQEYRIIKVLPTDKITERKIYVSEGIYG